MIVTQSVQRAIHCINPNCPRPYPNIWGNKYCRSCGAPLQFKRYVPLQLLGAGGFARIYTVWDLQFHTQRVLKVLTDTSPKALELFEQEAAVLANLHHPGVPKVEADGFFSVNLGDSQPSLPCLVMEKINGQTLQEVLEQHPQGCPEEWVLAWLKQAVDILQALHNRQIVHRDIKPSNLMLREATGQLVLIDFGGAKQIGTVSRLAASTRLYTSGYSPPEQVAGAAVGPAADVYALGRTMIELLTGKYISEVQDPNTGELHWRHLAPVSPATADLLDEMVREDVRRRPANAQVIQERLARLHKASGWVSLFKLVLNSWNSSRIVFRSLTIGLSKTTIVLLKALVQAIRACLDTVWEMLLGFGGACVGAFIGFVLAYWSPLGAAVAHLLSQQLAFLVPNAPIVESDVVLFAFAGLGTAWGLTAAGGFGQRRRYSVAAFMGLFGYGLSGLIWQLLTHNTGDIGIVGFVAIAVAFLTLGLKLPSHHSLHAGVAAIGCAAVFFALVSLGIAPPELLNLFPLGVAPGWQELAGAIALLATLGATLGFWLGISYYLVVPIVRFLGW